MAVWCIHSSGYVSSLIVKDSQEGLVNVTAFLWCGGYIYSFIGFKTGPTFVKLVQYFLGFACYLRYLSYNANTILLTLSFSTLSIFYRNMIVVITVLGCLYFVLVILILFALLKNSSRKLEKPHVIWTKYFIILKHVLLRHSESQPHTQSN